MPRYPYICDACDDSVNVFKSISRYNDPEICPSCGAVMDHDFMALGTPATLDKAYRKPIMMYSIAPETPQQLADLRRKCPDTEFTHDLVPLAHNLAEKGRLLAAVDFEEKS